MLLGLGILLSTSILGYHRWGTIDAMQRLAVTRSIVHRGSVVTPEYGPVKYGLTQPVLMIPFYTLGYGAGKLAGSPDPERVGYRFTAFLFSPLLTAAIVAVFAYFGARFFGSTESSVLASLVLFWCTPLVGYSRLLFTEPLNALLILSSFALVEASLREPSRSFPTALAVQAVLVLNHVPFFGVLLGTIAFLFLVHPEFRDGIGRTWLAAYAISTLLLCCGVWGAYGFARYGAFLQVGYQGETFSTNPLVGLYGLLLSVGRGLVVYAPATISVLLVLGEGRLREWRSGSLAALLFAGYAMLYATWGSFEGGWCWGPRFLIPFLPLALLPLVARYDGLRLQPRRRWSLDGALALAGLLIGFLEFLGAYQEPERQVFESGTVDYMSSVFDPRFSSLAHSWDGSRALSRLPQFVAALGVSIVAGFLAIHAAKRSAPAGRPT